jgi:type II secretory pathway predicted ATPase ExeA
MDYLTFYNLNDDPFRLTPDPAYYYPSSEHNEILTSLDFAIEQKEGFSLVVGEPGTGKTTILRILIDHWKEKADIALVMTPRLSPEEFLQAVLEDIHVKLKKINKNEMLKAFRDILIEHSRIGKRVIIIVDEAQNVPDDTLEELRLLSNLETEKEKLLQIILLGQPELKKRLEADHLKQLNQRITIRATLRPLTRSETSDYVNFRLIKAGRGSVTFDDNARKAIFKISKGIPRIINIVSSRAIMAAFVSGSAAIKKKHVKYAIEHLSDKPSSKKYFAYAAYGALAAVLIFAIMYGLYKTTGYSWQIAAARQSEGQKASSSISEMTSKPVIDNVKSKTVDGPLMGKTEAKKTQYPKEAPPAVEKEVRQPGESHPGTITVSVSSATLRNGPSIEADKVAWASKGTSLRVLEESQESMGKAWYKVRLTDGRTCWISKKVVK